MGFKACMGVLMALGIPLLATRQHKWAIPMACLLFVPIYLSKSSICIAGGITGLLFVLWFRLSKGLWFGVLGSLCVLGGFYVKFVDMPMGTFMDRIHLWKNVLHDCVIHPWQGWGLDSFRHMTAQKEHLYAMNAQKTSVGMYVNIWDNPHNIYISLFFEWGIIGLLLLGGYLRDMAIKFKNRMKDSQTLALTGFMIVFFIVSVAQFPMFLARTACFLIPAFALWECQLEE